MPDPNVYASYRVQGTKHCLLRNDQNQEILITEDAAGDVAIMMADFCRDPDLAEFVADTWSGRSWDLREFPEDDDDDDDWLAIGMDAPPKEGDVG